MLTRLIQYLLPFRSGKLWPKCVPDDRDASQQCRLCHTTTIHGSGGGVRPYCNKQKKQY
jgi:hypothetical protein